MARNSVSGRLKNTIEYLGMWEALNNPQFKGGEFDPLLREAGSNAYPMVILQFPLLLVGKQDSFAQFVGVIDELRMVFVAQV